MTTRRMARRWILTISRPQELSQWAGGDEKKNCLLSQSHGAKPENLDSNFSFVWFRLGSGFAVGETL